MSEQIQKIEEALSEGDDRYYDKWSDEWYVEQSGKWKKLEEASIGEDIPVEGIGFVTKVHEDLSYHEGAYENDVEMVFQVNKYAYYRVDGTADSYGTTTWDEGVVQVFPEQVIQTVYKAR